MLPFNVKQHDIARRHKLWPPADREHESIFGHIYIFVIYCVVNAIFSLCNSGNLPLDFAAAFSPREYLVKGYSGRRMWSFYSQVYFVFKTLYFYFYSVFTNTTKQRLTTCNATSMVLPLQEFISTLQTRLSRRTTSQGCPSLHDLSGRIPK